jgi:hypothetical protein
MGIFPGYIPGVPWATAAAEGYGEPKEGLMFNVHPEPRPRVVPRLT